MLYRNSSGWRVCKGNILDEKKEEKNLRPRRCQKWATITCLVMERPQNQGQREMIDEILYMSGSVIEW